MWELTYEFAKEKFNQEVLNYCSINERFDSEPDMVKELRIQYALLFSLLLAEQERVWRSEAGRNYSIAITELETSCMRSIKAVYLTNK